MDISEHAIQLGLCLDHCTLNGTLVKVVTVNPGCILYLTQFDVSVETISIYFAIKLFMMKTEKHVKHTEMPNGVESIGNNWVQVVRRKF